MRNRSPISSTTTYNPIHDHNHKHRTFSLCSLQLFLFLLAACIALFVIFQIQSLQTPPPPPSLSSHPSSWAFIHEWQNFITNTITGPSAACVAQEAKAAAAAANDKLRRAVTFLPLKDLRYAQTAQQGHTWFMSSMYDTQEEGEVQYQQFPSEASNGRLLCIKGRDNHDGSWNSYALAWPDTLPYNATLTKGLTFVLNNHYNYVNLWHGLSAVVPLVGWHIKNGCLERPTRWVLYHWGELRIYMSPWVQSLMEATFSVPVNVEGFDNSASGGGGGGSGEEEEGAVCFEEAVVTRHNEGGMSSKRKLEVYDLLRCKVRKYCNVSLVVEGGAGRQGVVEIGMTMLMRTGSRSFRNQSAVVGIFQRECKKVNGCRLRVAHPDNLTFCEQVKLMSLTDIVVSPHGAQLTNLIFMDKNSSVMEFFPKGWLKLAGVGQYVFHWLASWSGMKHRGAWWDPDGDQCPYGDEDPRCKSFYKNGLIGYNETFFAEWTRNVLNDVKVRKMEEASKNGTIVSLSDSGCACSS
ncbi:Protein O-linked-mannose beta-1,4-N-acetylglucosaminyltransferase [Actinidia chinensis var. chinensis]|uniref:Protein O-linked-mannose beta-1,4-N-acetylglucosaminyltransferase n=1 Tax=Actinidia chinensis var. chinensis TaxID=1590841 RepID=A0A2R6RC94_ACTCC|nr:Protein O-linked-mannose beta-1,4-N-acetylglucosaminyltransferase [Actinidia chinensis var. chinensis]